MISSAFGIIKRLIYKLDSGMWEDPIVDASGAWLSRILKKSPKIFLDDISVSSVSDKPDGIDDPHHILPFDSCVIAAPGKVFICVNSIMDGEHVIKIYSCYSSENEPKLCNHVTTISMYGDSFGWDSYKKTETGLVCDDQMIDMYYPGEALSDLWYAKHAPFLAIMYLREILECKNVELKTITTPKSVNSKRIKKGKNPLFEYKILTINNDRLVPGVRKRTSKGKPVRLHLRRGHIRHHPTAGNVWVRQCAVGRAENGVIRKDYHVKGGAI